jgi:hypothetical protein
MGDGGMDSERLTDLGRGGDKEMGEVMVRGWKCRW